MTAVRCDLVIPVYNALRSTRDCLAAARRFAPPWARVVVVNDGSDARTTEWLRAQKGILLLENPVNLGFVKTANRGLVFSDAPYVCLLNSDTLLTEGALERMVARMEADPAIALCCPLSNEAVNLSVRIPPGTDVFRFGRRVARTSPALYPDAVTVVGFCLLFRRSVIRSLGVFDEVFGRGYCEETDYHYRCRAAGWRCVVADDAFVYHRHGASFTDRDARFARNIEILMARWRRLHAQEIAEFDRKNALGALRDDAYEWRLPDDAPEPADVLFLLSSLEAPGAASVLQLADALVMRGKAVTVALLDASAPADVELFFRPVIVSPERLREALPSARAVVATDTATAAALAGAFGGDAEIRAGLVEATLVEEASVRELLTTRAAFLPRAGISLLPLSAEPDLFYPRASRSPAGGAMRVAVREPIGSGHEETLFAALPREKRATLFGTVDAVVETSEDSAAIALEAMASGAVPIVAAGSTAEAVVRDEVDALVVPAAGPSRALGRIASDRALRARLAEAGLAAARERTWSGAAEAFERWSAELGPIPALSPEREALLERLVAARPRPASPVRDLPPMPVRSGLRARLGRLKRRIAALPS